jgi:hypothetical protein
MDPQVIGCGDLKWIQLAQDRVQQQAPVNMEINLCSQ